MRLHSTSRRTLTGLIVGLAAALFALPASAQVKFDKPITIAVPYAAGGGTDAIARMIAEPMSRILGHSIIVENVVGAAGTVANDRVAKSTPDGTTILINHLALLAAPSLFTNLRYDTRTAFEPVGIVNTGPMVLIGRKTIPGKTPKELVEWIKATGAKANIAHGGIGTNSHLCAVLMGNVLGFKPTFVAYRGSGPAVSDLIGGQIDLLWDQSTNAMPQVTGGTLHGIAVTSSARLEEIRDVPTASELGMPDINYAVWHGLYVAKGTPAPVVAALNDALVKTVRDPAIVSKFKQVGTTPMLPVDRSAAAHARIFTAELARITKLVESSGAKPAEAK